MSSLSAALSAAALACAGTPGLVESASRGDTARLSASLEASGSELATTRVAADALIAAARNDQLEAVRALLEAGVPVGVSDASGRTPLHHAAVRAGVPTIELLVLESANLNARDTVSGATPLVLAARADHVAGIYALARAGAQVDLAESGGRGETPLHAAVESSAFRSVRLLLQADADPYAPDRRGDSALAKASARNDAELQAMFRLALAGRAGDIPPPRARRPSDRGAGGSAARFLTRRRSAEEGVEQVYSLAAPGRPEDEAAGAAPGRASASRRAGAARVDVRRAYGRRVAAVVGIDAYQRWPALEGARRDSRRMAAELRAQGFDEVLELYDGEATRSRILDLLGRQLSERTGADDLAFIFFAGHGETETLPDGRKRGYIVPVDASPNAIYSTGISMATLRDLSGRLDAKHVFYAMDSCYSGLGLVRGMSVRRSAEEDYIDKVTSLRAVQMVTAGTEGELAIERGGEGLFTTYLIRALRGEADFDGDGVVTAGEIGVFVRPQVSAASGNRQTPQFGTIEGTGEVVFPLP